MSIDVTESDLDFSELHKSIQRYVDEGIIPFANSVVLQGDNVIELQFYDNADLESEQPPDNRCHLPYELQY
jgi:hypothetical protein